STVVSFVQGANTFTTSCTGTTGTQLSCTINMTAAVAGNTQMVVTANGHTLTTPGDPLIGGIVVTP
ncbi:MAG TPA: hypothetical protein VGO07_05305, partial [Candidatus Saccharimonadales bacterium]|nr:hypothetical protein [Candidatus Saccharimonadales bacterium]